MCVVGLQKGRFSLGVCWLCAYTSCVPYVRDGRCCVVEERFQSGEMAWVLFTETSGHALRVSLRGIVPGRFQGRSVFSLCFVWHVDPDTGTSYNPQGSIDSLSNLKRVLPSISFNAIGLPTFQNVPCGFENSPSWLALRAHSSLMPCINFLILRGIPYPNPIAKSFCRLWPLFHWQEHPKMVIFLRFSKFYQACRETCSNLRVLRLLVLTA